MVAEIHPRSIGRRKLGELLVEKLSDPVSDVAIAAAVHLATSGDPFAAPEPMHAAAGPVLEEFGLLQTGKGRVCGIARSFERLPGKKTPAMDWAAFFGKDYAAAERQAVFCNSNAAVDVTAWVNAMDVFNDLLLAALTGHDLAIGNYELGRVGSFVKEPTSRFAKSYPAVWRLTHELHAKRGESHLSHAWIKQGTTYIRPTSFIPYKYLKTAKPLILQAITELSVKFPPPK